MTDKMTEQDKEIEEILRSYRPVGPPQRLRSRVLSPARSDTKPIRPWRVWAFRAAVAAVVLLAVGLRLIPIICLAVAILATPGKGF